MGTARQEIPRVPDYDRRLVKILHLRASNFYGGPERQLHLHAKLALASRYAVTVGSFAEAGEIPEFVAVIGDDGISTHTFPVASAYDRSAIPLVRQWLQANQVSILCTHDYRSHLIGYLARRGLPIKWIAFSRGFTWDNFKVRIYHWIEKLLIRLADHIVAVSESQRAKLLRLHVPARKISVIHNAIDTHALEGVAPVDLKARFGFPADAVIAVAAGRFSREKGQALLVQAAQLAARKFPTLRLVLFGNGPDIEQVKQLIMSLQLDGIVLCPGFERNALGCLKSADMLVNPSLTEGLPNIVLEAMALGVPVIATAVGGVPELLINDESGLMVPPLDQYALSEAMIKLAASQELRHRLAEAALRTVRESFSFEGQMAQLAAVYDRVLEK